MRHLQKFIIQVREDDMTVVEVEVENKFIEFYKKETGHSHVTKKGLSKFLNHLVELHSQ